MVDAGVRLDGIVWDADEVLWDWVMSVASMVRDVPTLFRTRSILSHTEFLRLKPGIWELLWGMHHASLERELDPYMRIWTAGYTWRLWRIAQHLPGFTALLGPPADVDLGPSSFDTHPRIMCRSHTTGALVQMISPGCRGWLDELPPRIRHLLLTHVQRSSGHAGLKIPELAELIGKPGFGASRVLVDDAHDNVARFVAAGRSAVRLNQPAPRLFRGRVPNAVWRRPQRHLDAVAGDIASPLADALTELAGAGYPGRRIDIYPADAEVRSTLSFQLDVPGDIINAEWVAPTRALKRALDPAKI